MLESLPISYKEFLKNPIVGLLFICVLAIGYLYFDNRNTLQRNIDDLKVRVEGLEKENKQLNDKFIDLLRKVK
jgi:hypothetical protein